MRAGRALGSAVAGLVAGAVVISALAASNAVPTSKMGLSAGAIAVNDKTPKPECLAIVVTGVTTGAGVFNGTNGADLITGGTGNDTIGGRNGADCIVGGAGDDTLTGGTGIDICIGGLGNDVHAGTCETFIQ